MNYTESVTAESSAVNEYSVNNDFTNFKNFFEITPQTHAVEA